MTMLFSIVIPTYNRGALLSRTLDSVFRQSCTDFEVIVVDDGSTDGTIEQLKQLGDRVRTFTQPNQGPGAARNLGWKQAVGEYIAFLDSDDLWFEWTLATFATLIEQHDRPAILAAKLIEFCDEEELQAICRESLRAEAYDDYFASYEGAYYVGSGMAVLRRDAVASAGGFTEDRFNAEDHDLILRMGTSEGFVRIESPVTLGWRRHTSSATEDVRSTAVGVLRLIRNEAMGKYPGDDARGFQRHRILTSHARPASMGCLAQGAVRDAWNVYRATLGWHIRQGRWRYVAIFPFLLTWAAARDLVRVEVT